jgi:hypothetical protein
MQKCQTTATQTECSSGYTRKKRSIRLKVTCMKRICDKIADKGLEKHREMAIRNCQTSRIMYTQTQTLSLLDKYSCTEVIYSIGMTYFVLRI